MEAAMRRMNRTAAILALLATAWGAQSQDFDPAHVRLLAKDAPKAADHPLTRRYEGANLLGQTVKAFDEISLPAGPAEGATYDDKRRYTSVQPLAGKVTRTIHLAPKDRSSLEVFVNYKDELTAKGFQPVFECARETCGASFVLLKYYWQKKETQIQGEGYEQVRNLVLGAVFDSVVDPRYALMRKAAPEGDTWVAVLAAQNSGGSFGTYTDLVRNRVSVLTEVVEPRALERRMSTVSAAEIGSKLAAEGRAVFYNILFDFDKAELKPDSRPQLAEMAAMLKASPQLKVFIIGHTDAKGGLDYNVGLSGKRAAAVAAALAKDHGIAAARLVTRGLGPLAPVATNRTDEGREKNRRVEMVEQ
jgi:outer membrane protein OmpA-like peptidoglycan-associated protein